MNKSAKKKRTVWYYVIVVVGIILAFGPMRAIGPLPALITVFVAGGIAHLVGHRKVVEANEHKKAA